MGQTLGPPQKGALKFRKREVSRSGEKPGNGDWGEFWALWGETRGIREGKVLLGAMEKSVKNRGEALERKGKTSAVNVARHPRGYFRRKKNEKKSAKHIKRRGGKDVSMLAIFSGRKAKRRKGCAAGC